MLEDDGKRYTMNLCESCYNLRQSLEEEARGNHAVEASGWFEEFSRQKCGWIGALGFEHKIMETYAGMKIYAKNLLKGAAVEAG